jgi:type I restriction enzyme, S subunit
MNWEKVKFSKIAKLTKGISYTSSDYCGKGEGAIFVTLKCIAKNGGFSNRGIKYFSGLIPKNQLLKRNDLLFANTDLTRDGDVVGCPVYLPDLGGDFPITMSMDLSRVDFIDEDVDTEFVYYQLMTDRVRRFMKENSSGSTVLHLNTAKVYDLEINLPTSKTEQKRIAEILSTADAAIEQTQALIAKYNRIKRGLMQDLLTCGVDENGNIRNKQTHKFTVKKGIEVPDDWEVDCVGNNADLHNNLRKPISSLERFEKQGHYPYFGATGIIDYISEYRVEGKFVLIGEDGDHYLKFNKQELTQLVCGKFNVSNHAHILSGKNYCSTEWIHHYFCHRDITYYLTRQGAGRFKLNKTALLNLPICVPSLREQSRIIEFIDTFNRNFQIEKQKLAKLQSIKKGLMQDLLSGRRQVKSKK